MSETKSDYRELYQIELHKVLALIDGIDYEFVPRVYPNECIICGQDGFLAEISLQPNVIIIIASEDKPEWFEKVLRPALTRIYDKYAGIEKFKYCSICEQYQPLTMWTQDDNRCDGCVWDAQETEAYGETCP